jgi:hypothetical protein
MTIGAFATDGDLGYDTIHEAQRELNMIAFWRNHDISMWQHFRGLSDILHLLKCARYRILKKITMVVGLETDTAQRSLERFIEVIGGDFPAVVFSDEQVTKMHDLLPMALFRLEILLRPYESWEFAWVAYCFPWILINKAMSHKNVEVYDRLAWFLTVYCYLMTCLEKYQNCELGTGMSPFRQKKIPNTTRRTLFDQKLLIHATNSIAGILYEIRNAPQGTKIFLQRLSTVRSKRSSV